MQSFSRREFLASASLLQPSRLAADPDRPRFHLLPPGNWMNDPNAPVYHAGTYHMYYQHNPKAAKWDTMHWGHATSADLVHWKHQPISLAPTPGGPDKDGCFTGCMVIENGEPVLVYTGVQPEVQCIARSRDFQNWTKHPRPVIASPPPGVDTPGFRDPHVWREGGEWLMLLGAGFRGVGGTTLLYKSRNLVEWTYLKPLLSGKIDQSLKGGDVARGEMWECPDFFPVEDKHLLYVSTMDKVIYFLGEYKDRTFVPESSGVLIHGAAYAPKSCSSIGGRRLIFSWLREQRSGEEQLRAGWSGVMSLAAVPYIGPDGKLRLGPAGEYRNITSSRHGLKDAPDDCCEIVAELDGTRPFAIKRAGRILFEYSPADGSISAGPVKAPISAKRFTVRVFIDGSVIEVFTSEPVTLAGRVYGAMGKLSVEGSPRDFEAWALAPISSDRLTS